MAGKIGLLWTVVARAEAKVKKDFNFDRVRQAIKTIDLPSFYCDQQRICWGRSERERTENEGHQYH